MGRTLETTVTGIQAEERIVREEVGTDYESISEAPEQITEDGETYRLTGTDYEEVYKEVEEEQRIREEFTLTSEDLGQIPKTVTRGGVEYKLDTDSVSLRVSRTEISHGSDIVEETVNLLVEDNDIDRLERELMKDGRILELIEIEYAVADATESGIPLTYEAKCRYAANVDQDQEIPVEWVAQAEYEGVEKASLLEKVIARNTYERILPEEPISDLEAETMAMEEEEIPMAVAPGDQNAFLETSLEKASVPLKEEEFQNVFKTGIAGVGILGIAFLCALFFRKKNRVAIYMEGEEKKPIGKTYARVEQGLLVVSIPETLMERTGVSLKRLVLKPSGNLLRGKVRQAKVVSSSGILYVRLRDTIALWEDGISGIEKGKQTGILAV